MTSTKYRIWGASRHVLGAALACAAQVVFAQDSKSPQSDIKWQVWEPDPANLSMPQISFTETPETVKDYDKYFYFHREDTGFSEALADLRECDERARRIWRGKPTRRIVVDYPRYGLAVDFLMEEVLGPAQDRLFRRANLRRCMFYKGYARYGLPKEQWEGFNLEGNVKASEERSHQMSLARQALVASGPRPAQQALGL